MRLLIGLLVVLFLFQGSVATASAKPKNGVLGESVRASEVEFPPVTSGPGFILPDSPVYFLDQWVQQFKLTIAQTPEQKAKVREMVSGERLAELRVMMARENTSGITTSLAELSKQVDGASRDLVEQKAAGQNVHEAAKVVNEMIKTELTLLKEIETAAKGSLQAGVKATRIALKERKVAVEEHLSESDLAREIEGDVEREIADNLADTNQAANSLSFSIDLLTQLASQAAEQKQTNREAALRGAIANRNKAQDLEAEDATKTTVLPLDGRTAAITKEIVESAQEASKQFEAAKIKRQEVASSTDASEKDE